MDTLKTDCPCKRLKCERHGNCKACKEHHHLPQSKYLTTCERLKLKEEQKSKKNIKNQNS